MTAPLPVCVDGRFQSAPLTGVQRYARSALAALGRRSDLDLRVVANKRAQHLAGVRGHLWEQVELPLLRGDRVLLSPANWGPVAVRRQVLVLQDVAPLVHPEYFSHSYVLATRALLPTLVRRVAVVAVGSEFSRAELHRVLDVPADKVVVAESGLDPHIFAPAPQTGTQAPFGLFVGGHDTRKNLAFALRLWPRVWREHGLRLVVTRRGAVTVTRAEAAVREPWIDVVVDPSDQRLAELYSAASVLVWPSHYEGFGLPLLEAAALGTPFVSTESGAAPQLARRPWQIQPLDDDAWRFAIGQALAPDPSLDSRAHG